MVKKQISKQEALTRLKHLCATKEKCLSEVKQKLWSWQLSDAFDEISASLLDEDYINEQRYAESFVNDKIRFSYWGRRKVKFALRSKDIPEEIIAIAIQTFPDDDYTAIAEKEILKKLRSLNESDSNKKYQKIIAFAGQRGYETEIVGKIMDRSDL